MTSSIFCDITELNASYLDEAYADDAETAAVVFEQYLEDLPSNLNLIAESLTRNDAESFRRHIHKQKPGFSYVGLTDVTDKLTELEKKCLTAEDLQTYKSEINATIARIHSVTSLIGKTLVYLQQLKRA